MKTILINYADRRFLQAQKLNSSTGLEIGGFDRAISYRRKFLDWGFRARNWRILSERRGAGYWLWKPYLVVRTLKQMAPGDVLFYCDSGAHFIAPVGPVVEHCRVRADGILLFTLEDQNLNRIWTKRDCFHYMGLDSPPYTNAPQIAATYIVCEKSARALAFFEEWLAYAQDARILTDRPNACGLENYPDFRDHRHDQSILSLLARKHAVATLPDISQWGNDRRPTAIPQIVELTRWSK